MAINHRIQAIDMYNESNDILGKEKEVKIILLMLSMILFQKIMLENTSWLMVKWVYGFQNIMLKMKF